MDHVALVYPPYSQEEIPSTISPPMGVLAIASVLEPAGYKVSVLDANVERIPYEEIVERLQDQRPDVIGISTPFSALHNSTLHLAPIIKEAMDVPLVIGGNHAAAMADYFAQKPYIDFVIRGEGEAAIVNFLTALRSSGSDVFSVEGLSYMNNGTVVNTPAPPLIDLEQLPFPAYHLLDMDKYHEYNIMFSRGCPYECTFCAVSVAFTRKVRNRTIESVVEELTTLVERYGPKDTVFYDDTFTLNLKYIHGLLDAIIDADLGLQWRCATRVNVIKPDLLQKMKRAGCILIKYGIESGNDLILKNIKKDMKRETIKEAIDLTKKAGMPHSAFFMVGNLEESWETLYDSYQLIKEFKPESGSFSITVPLPGTELAEEVVNQGIIDLEKVDWDFLLPVKLLTRDYERYSAVLASKWCHLSPDEIIEGAEIGKWMVRLNYLYSPRLIWSVFRRWGLKRIFEHYAEIFRFVRLQPGLFVKATKIYFALGKTGKPMAHFPEPKPVTLVEGDIREY
jgi:radical SAM superfamily enzyme YgiQ (UPF0313 family)